MLVRQNNMNLFSMVLKLYIEIVYLKVGIKIE